MAALLVLFFAGVPAAGYVAILWSVGTFVDMLAPQALTISWSGSRPPRSCSGSLWVPSCFYPATHGVACRALANRRESVVMAVFLAAVVGGVAVGVENGASLHAAAFDMRLMLFYAAFWPALAALASGRELVLKLVAAGAVVVVILQILQVIVGPAAHLFVIAPSDLASSLTDERGSCGFAHPGSRRSTSSLRSPSRGFSGDRLGIGWAAGRWRRWRSPAWSWSLNRNMLLGLALGLCVAAPITPQRHRFAVLIATVGLVLSGFGLLAQTAGLSARVQSCRALRASPAHYSALKQQTLDDRYYETTFM